VNNNIQTKGVIMKRLLILFLLLQFLNFAFAKDQDLKTKSIMRSTTRNIVYFKSGNHFIPAIKIHSGNLIVLNNEYTEENLLDKIIVYNNIIIPYELLPKRPARSKFGKAIIYEYKNRKDYEKENVAWDKQLLSIKGKLARQKAYLELMKIRQEKSKEFPGYNISPYPDPACDIIYKKLKLNTLKLDNDFSLIGLFLDSDYDQIFYAFDNIKLSTDKTKTKYPPIETKNKSILVQFIPISDSCKEDISDLLEESKNEEIGQSDFLPQVNVVELGGYSKIPEENKRLLFIEKYVNKLDVDPNCEYQLIIGRILKNDGKIKSIYFKYEASPIENVRFSTESETMQLKNKKHFAILIDNTNNFHYNFVLPAEYSSTNKIRFSYRRKKMKNIEIIQCSISINEL